MKEIARNDPHLQIGDIEVYPYYGVAKLKEWLAALERNGVVPAHFHLMSMFIVWT